MTTKVPIELSSTPSIVDGGNATAITIDSSENVGIGSSTINAKLNVHGTIRAENERFLAGREDASAPAYAFHDDADTGMFNVASNQLCFATSGSERVRIDDSGNLLVGTTTFNNLSTESGVLASNNVVMARGGLADHQDACAVLQYSSDATWLRAYGDTSGSGYMVFRTGGGAGSGDTERARIDASGRFAIGVTNPADYYATNLVVQGASEGGITIASTSTQVWNYIMFADGTSGDARYRGYIGYNHNNDRMAIAAGGSERIQIDSDGLKFGSDTAAANALDDYEEGSWTARITSSTGTALGTQNCTYTKIGRLVTIRFDMTNDTGSSSSAIYGLPFDSDGHGGVHIVWNNMDSSEATGGYTSSGYIVLVQSGTDNGWAFTNGNRMIGFGTYFTTL